jgi:hypothetical protein
MECDAKRLETFTNCHQVQMYLFAYPIIEHTFLMG